LRIHNFITSFGKNKKPAEHFASAGLILKIASYKVCILRYASPPSRYARDDDGGDGHEAASNARLRAGFGSVKTFDPDSQAVFSMDVIKFSNSSAAIRSSAPICAWLA
jgi:hypothetical protein